MTKVAELLSPNSLSWNDELVAMLFNREEFAATLNLELPQVTCEDSLFWMSSDDENFTVKSCFGVIQMMGLDMDNDSFWGLIWGSDLPERLKLFLWQLASNVLPTKKVLASMLGRGDILCGLCGQKEEELLHLFKYCSVSKALGFASS